MMVDVVPCWAHSKGACIEMALAEYTHKRKIYTWRIPTMKECEKNGGTE